jgi:hypothetical protein
VKSTHCISRSRFQLLVPRHKTLPFLHVFLNHDRYLTRSSSFKTPHCIITVGGGGLCVVLHIENHGTDKKPL